MTETNEGLNQSQCLSVLTRAPSESVKSFVEPLLPLLSEIEVLKNRTGLVMLPYQDSRQGKPFLLGEVLVSEAHVRIEGVEGYAACIGRDHEQALAVAILDALLRAGRWTDQVQAFVRKQSEHLVQADRELLRQVEATRVELETF